MTDREKLTKLVEESFADQHDRRRMIVVPDTVNSLLANGVVVREKGEWESCIIYTGNWINTCTYGSEGWACSVCGEGVLEKRNFCPNCGADMKKGENDG